MKNILLITILTSFCFSQAEEWIYFNNMTDFEYVPYFGPIMDFSVTRISPDGSENEIILEDVQYSDLSEDHTKILYIDGGHLRIYNTETMETDSSITGIPNLVFTRFTQDENVVLYIHGSLYSSIQTLYKYSFTDSSTTMLSDSLSVGFDNMTLSPDGQQVVYFQVTEDEDTEDYFMDVAVVVADIQSGESTILATIPYLDFSGNGIWDNNPYWSDNGFIYLTFLDDNGCNQLFGIHSTYGYITQLTDEPYSDPFGYFCVSSILGTKETGLDKFVYTTCSDSLGSNEHWIYDIASNESSYLGYFGGENYGSIAMDQTWSSDQSKVAFNEWLYGGMIIIPGYLRVYDTVTESIDTVGNVLNLDDPESYYAAGPIYWIDESEVSIAEPTDIVPEEFVLYPPYPNPFNPISTIRFDTGVGEAILHPFQLTVYDITGRVVDVLVNGKIESGQHEIQWNASQYSSGLYFVELFAGKKRDVQKLILLK